MIKDVARRLLRLSSSAQRVSGSRPLSILSVRAPFEMSEGATSANPARERPDLPTSEVLSEQLDSVRVALGTLVREPRAALVSSENVSLVQSIKSELQIIQRRIEEMKGASLWGGPHSSSHASQASFDDCELPRDGVTVFHERERIVTHSARGSEEFARNGAHAAALRLADGTLLTSEMADQLLQQLAALHAEQHAPPVSLLLLSELSEVRALCRTLKEKITTLESLHEKRSREVHAAADSLELQLEGHIESLKGVMTSISAVRGGAKGI